jgi:hypothetical protein
VLRVTVNRDGATREVAVDLAPSTAYGARLPIQVRIAVAPDATAAGEEVSFAARYAVVGQNPVEVVERREIIKDGQILGSWLDTFTRSPGRVASEKRVRVDPRAAPGEYLARITLDANGRLYRAYAEFEVRPRAHR